MQDLPDTEVLSGVVRLVLFILAGNWRLLRRKDCLSVWTASLPNNHLLGPGVYLGP